MSFINIIGIILLASVIIIGTIAKLYTRSKLEEMNGLGAVHTEETEEERGIHI